ncbi:hypothetical protein, partial [Paenibacillus sp.]|uniref:hypothetical protein n=1 Tax=Paenibacillus sp. TaxID=58172 RepID=UPI002D50A650
PEYIIDDAGQTNYVNQYPTIVGTGSNPQTESGQSFYVYFLNFDGTTVWGTYTSLMRKEITLN